MTSGSLQQAYTVSRNGNSVLLEKKKNSSKSHQKLPDGLHKKLISIVKQKSKLEKYHNYGCFVRSVFWSAQAQFYFCLFRGPSQFENSTDRNYKLLQ